MAAIVVSLNGALLLLLIIVMRLIWIEKRKKKICQQIGNAEKTRAIFEKKEKSEMRNTIKNENILIELKKMSKTYKQSAMVF